MKRRFWEAAEDVEGQPLKGRVILWNCGIAEAIS